MNRSVLRGILLITLAVAAIVAIVTMNSTKSKPKHPANNDPWVLVSYDPNNQYGTYLGNGFISTRIMADGVGSQNFESLPCYMAGLYNNEKLIPVPNWSDFRFSCGTKYYKLDPREPYTQKLDMKTGILTTTATWVVDRGPALTGTIEVVLSRAHPNVAMIRATMVPSFDERLHATLVDILEENKQLRQSSWDLVKTEIQKNQTITPVSASYRTQQNDKVFTIAQWVDSPNNPNLGLGNRMSLDVKRGKSFTVVSFIALASGSDEQSCSKEALSEIATAVKSPEEFIAAHKAAMAKLWEHDIIIDGPVQDQQAIHSCMFYLMQSVRKGSQWSIPPMGLSNNAFSGHVFWDADLWMFPALILQHPELARSIVDYRYNTLPGAMANAKADGFAGAQYAWESGYTGKEDIPKGLVYKNERHINGDVAIAQWQYYLATGDLNWLKTRGYPVIKATADWWVSKAKYVPTKGRYEILQVCPPDENAEMVNNSAYTNAIAKINLQIASNAAKLTGYTPNSKWAQVAEKMYIPLDTASKRFVAFDGYRGAKAKQADTELIAYPLQYVIPGVDMNPIYKSTFEFYAPKVEANGPAMTSSAHAVIAARLGNADQAYAGFTKSYKPYLRGPFNYFNEKKSYTWDNMCFLTGAAGPIQATLFGLAGAKMDYFPTDPTNAELKISPCLPKRWKSLKITGVQWHGKEFDVMVTQGNKVRVGNR